MRPRTFGAVVLVIAAVSVLLAGSAGARTVRGPAAMHLTSVAAAKAYVRSIGLNPRTFVVQKGRRNYAGPSCPGRRWKCTTAKHVIQFASGGSNSSECTGGFSEGGACVIVQMSESGTNTARCVERDTSPAATQDCQISQSNTTGTNNALVDQRLVQPGPTAFGNQNASINQSNVSGDNNASTNQLIDQRAESNGSGKGAADSNGQLQSSQQYSDVEQTNGTGRNSSDRTQDVAQFEHANGGSQEQDDNIDGTVNQNSAGVSTNSNRQHEHQNEIGGDEQFQFGPLSCCSFQTGNPSDTFGIDQNSEQHASSGAAAVQSNELDAFCETDGNCHVTQHVNENGSTANNEESGPVVSSFIVCGNVDEAPTAAASNNGTCMPFTGGDGF